MKATKKMQIEANQGVLDKIFGSSGATRLPADALRAVAGERITLNTEEETTDLDITFRTRMVTAVIDEETDLQTVLKMLKHLGGEITASIESHGVVGVVINGIEATNNALKELGDVRQLPAPPEPVLVRFETKAGCQYTLRVDIEGVLLTSDDDENEIARVTGEVKLGTEDLTCDPQSCKQEQKGIVGTEHIALEFSGEATAQSAGTRDLTVNLSRYVETDGPAFIGSTLSAVYISSIQTAIKETCEERPG